MTIQDLPHLNAALNSLSAALIVTGFVFIKNGRISAHRACMLSATAVSALFLASYLVYHFYAGHTVFPRGGTIKVVYLAILGSHVLLAITVPPLVGTAIWLGLTGRIPRHKRLVRWAFPIWLYVSVTGVVVYVMLYHLFPTR